MPKSTKGQVNEKIHRAHKNFHRQQHCELFHHIHGVHNAPAQKILMQQAISPLGNGRYALAQKVVMQQAISPLLTCPSPRKWKMDT